MIERGIGREWVEMLGRERGGYAQGPTLNLAWKLATPAKQHLHSRISTSSCHPFLPLNSHGDKSEEYLETARNLRITR
jgi:hypothetical protein